VKRTIILILVLTMVISTSVFATDSNKKMFVELQGNSMFPSDGNFKTIYGSSALYIRGKAGYKFIKDFYLFFGCGLLHKTGKTPLLKAEATSDQKICIFGAGYEGTVSGKLGYRLEAGGSNFSYKEEALDKSVSSSKLGIMLNGSIVYDFNSTIFTALSLGYFGASDTINNVDIKLGGLNIAFGFGIRI